MIVASQHVRRLEKPLGRPLVRQDGRASRFTPEGEALAGEARRILAAHNDALRRLGVGDSCDSLVLGSTDHAADELLPRVMERLLGEAAYLAGVLNAARGRLGVALVAGLGAPPAGWNGAPTCPRSRPSGCTCGCGPDPTRACSTPPSAPSAPCLRPAPARPDAALLTRNRGEAEVLPEGPGCVPGPERPAHLQDRHNLIGEQGEPLREVGRARGPTPGPRGRHR
ncbi:hypothetical protein WIS52_20345 [Pseudonocardia nematodicida]|uniref:HTH lysR-type domain-containing protein n=1 Tax=Pseudonocardia nematodicida TaxID=1206997 RepID=A0ABV1KEE7_9PSEU